MQFETLMTSKTNRTNPTMPLSVSLLTEFASKDYQRNNKRTGVKNLRCFPLCSPERHVQAGFCGQPVVLKLDNVPENLLPTDRLPGAKYPLVVWARFEQKAIPPWCAVDDHVPDAPFIADTRTRQTPTAAWMPGELIVFGKETKEVTTRINGDRLGYNYSWVSNKHTCDAKHCLRVYIFERIDKTRQPTTPSQTASPTASTTTSDDNLKCLSVTTSPSFKVYCRRRNKSTAEFDTNAAKKLAAVRQSKGKKRKASNEPLNTLASAAASTKRISVGDIVAQRGWHLIDPSAPGAELGLVKRKHKTNGRLTPIASSVLLEVLVQYCNLDKNAKKLRGALMFETIAGGNPDTTLNIERMLLRATVAVLFGCDVRKSMDEHKAATDNARAMFEQIADILVADKRFADGIAMIVGSIKSTSIASSVVSDLLAQARSAVAAASLRVNNVPFPGEAVWSHTAGPLYSAIEARVKEQSVLLSRTPTDIALMASGQYVCVEPSTTVDLFFKQLESAVCGVPDLLLALPYAIRRGCSLHVTSTELLVECGVVSLTSKVMQRHAVEFSIKGATHEVLQGNQLKKFMAAAQSSLRGASERVGTPDLAVTQSGWIEKTTGAVVTVQRATLEQGRGTLGSKPGIPNVVIVKQKWSHDDKTGGQDGDALSLHTEVRSTQGGISTVRNLVQKFVRTCDLRLLTRVVGATEIMWANPVNEGTVSQSDSGSGSGSGSGNAGAAVAGGVAIAPDVAALVALTSSVVTSAAVTPTAAADVDTPIVAEVTPTNAVSPVNISAAVDLREFAMVGSDLSDAAAAAAQVVAAMESDNTGTTTASVTTYGDTFPTERC